MAMISTTRPTGIRMMVALKLSSLFNIMLVSVWSSVDETRQLSHMYFWGLILFDLMHLEVDPCPLTRLRHRPLWCHQLQDNQRSKLELNTSEGFGIDMCVVVVVVVAGGGCSTVKFFICAGRVHYWDDFRIIWEGIQKDEPLLTVNWQCRKEERRVWGETLSSPAWDESRRELEEDGFSQVFSDLTSSVSLPGNL